jgi:hypothetical protein
MASLNDLRAGDLAFGPIGGGVGVGVGLGQILVSPWKTRLSWKRWWRVRHTGVVVPGGAVDNRFLVQAEPGGVESIQMHPDRYWSKDWIYIRPNYAPGQADRVAEIAQRQARKKIPYAFECYPAIALNRVTSPFGFGLHHWLGRTDADGDPVRVICSWEVDSALTLAGFQVFNDGRAPHDVIPSELYLRLLELGPSVVLGRDVHWAPNLPGTRHATRTGPGQPTPVPAYLL